MWLNGRRRFWLLSSVLILCLVLPCNPCVAGDYLLDDEAVAGSAGEHADPLERGFREQKSETPHPSPFKEELKELPLFFSDTSLLLNARNYYLDRNKLDNSNSNAWALGGSLEYQSGKIYDVASIGTEVFTSQKLSGPESRDGTLLLRDGQQSYTVLGTLYTRFEYEDHLLTLFRQKYNLPYVNKRDNRMTPNTFEGYSLSAKSERNPNFQYTIGYIDKIKVRNSTSFKHMSEVAGAKGSKKGTILSGARYNVTENYSLGGVNYYTPDVLNIFYGQTDYIKDFENSLELKISFQFSDQSSVGDDLLSGESYSTQAYGTQSSLSYNNAILTFAFTSNATTANLISPWGSYAGYNSMIINDYNRAGENTWRIGLSYDFKDYFEGFSAYANYVSGNRAVDDDTRASLPDKQETNVTVDYRVKDGILKDLWIRLRAAIVHEDGGNILEDYRVIVNHPLAIL